MSGMSQVRTPMSDTGCFQSAGSVGSRLTATNLTEFENQQRQISRKDRTRSTLHGECPTIAQSLPDAACDDSASRRCHR